jgi:hypothetical protein
MTILNRKIPKIMLRGIKFNKKWAFEPGPLKNLAINK